MADKITRTTAYKLAITAICAALTVILSVLPIGYIKIGAIAITIVHIPTIITVITAGLVPGLCSGLIFGLTSLIKASTSASPFDHLFVNPLISVLPRILFALIVWLIYKGLSLNKKTPRIVSAPVAAGIGTVAHTFMVLSLLYLNLFVSGNLADFNLADSKCLSWIWGIFISNGIFEAAAAVIITVLVIGSIYADEHRKSKISRLEKDTEDENKNENI